MSKNIKLSSSKGVGCHVCGATICTSKSFELKHPIDGVTHFWVCINCAMAHIKDLVYMMESLALRAQDEGFMS